MKLNLTDLLDLAGSILVVAALAVLVLPLGLAASLGVAGAGLLATSYLIDNPLADVLAAHKRRAQLRRDRRKGTSS